MFVELAAPLESSPFFFFFLPATVLLGMKIVAEISWQGINFYNIRIFIGKSEGSRIGGVFSLVGEKTPTNFS